MVKIKIILLSKNHNNKIFRCTKKFLVVGYLCAYVLNENLKNSKTLQKIL